MIPAKEFEGEMWIRAADIHLLARDWPRTWSGLTDEEYKELHLQIGPVYYYQEYGQAIEAKLRKKNT